MRESDDEPLLGANLPHQLTRQRGVRRVLLLFGFVAGTALAVLYWTQPYISPPTIPAHFLETNEALQFIQVLETTEASQFIQVPETNAVLQFIESDSSSKPIWTWICLQNSCLRRQATRNTTLQSMSTCNMLCASQLWPQPTGALSLANTAAPVQARGFKLQIVKSPSSNVTEHLNDAFALMTDYFKMLEQSIQDPKSKDMGVERDVLVRVTIEGSADPRLRLDTDESYKLSLRPENNSLLVEISAHSFCGARHGFETLSQLVWMDPYAASLLTLESASVEDAPRFKYRGLLLDTARNYYPVKDILRTIDAMGACKLNTFHWHATDSQSFPLKLNSTLQFAENGAYGPGAVYTRDDIRAVVRRAGIRGIRVVIEIDSPAHIGRSWGPSAGENLAYCIDAEPWNRFCGEPPCGQLNPQNPQVYEILQNIYAEIIQLTGVDDVFHLGGDEVKLECWRQNIKNSDPTKLWLEFTQKAFQALDRANFGAPNLTLLWSSPLTRPPYLEQLKQFGVQVWGGSKDSETMGVLKAGLRTVMSNVDAWYLDCGFGSWRDDSFGHCPPIRQWTLAYEHRPWKDKLSSWKIEGGTACMWSEQVGPGGLDSRMWPRAAAVAERLWSDPGKGATADVFMRLDTHRSRLVAKGVGAEPLWPRWCSQNPQDCY